jgi:hypothetical protein
MVPSVDQMASGTFMINIRPCPSYHLPGVSPPFPQLKLDPWRLCRSPGVIPEAAELGKAGLWLL